MGKASKQAPKRASSAGAKRKAGPADHSASGKRQKTTFKSTKPLGGSKGLGKNTDQRAAAEAAATPAKAGPRKSEKREQLKNAVNSWEKLRRHDTSNEERAELIGKVLKQVDGRIDQVSSSHTGSRVLQACAKYGSAEQRKKMLAEILPQFLFLSRSPYAHFLICKLIATIPRQELKAVFSAVRGNVPMLLRHPSGAAVIDELYNAATAAQRNHLAAEFYGKEYSLLTHEAAPSSLSELLASVDSSKKRTILQRMAIHLIPIMEKALVDPVITHRLIAEYLQHTAQSIRQEAIESITGEALLRMVHTRDGAWVANAVLCYGTAKDCKKFVKALKGHVETMAKDKWGSLVLASALSHVDDTVMLRKFVLPTVQDKLEELVADKHARLIYLQLLAPDKSRYLQPELLSIVNPAVEGKVEAPKDAQIEAEDNAEADEENPSGTARKKDPFARRIEILGSGDSSLGAKLLHAARENVSDWLVSQTAHDFIVELATGASAGALETSHAEAVDQLQDAVVARLEESEGEAANDVYCSRVLRRLVLATKDKEYKSDITRKIADKLWNVFKGRKIQAESHSKKVTDAFDACGYE